VGLIFADFYFDHSHYGGSHVAVDVAVGGVVVVVVVEARSNPWSHPV